MQDDNDKISRVGHLLVDGFHYFALFVIGATIVWSAAYEYLHMIEQGYAKLKDILLLFIFLELGAMVGIYFKTHRLPVQFLIYVAITALSRHLVVDLKDLTPKDQLYILMGISGAILILTLSILVLAYATKRVGLDDSA
jgi:phosphate starvation-inducible membrane PsiE